VLIPGIPIITGVYILSLELGKGMGNVWYRTMQDGKKAIMLSSIPQFFVKPFTGLFMWYPNMWSINPYIFIYTILKVIDILYNLDKNDLKEID
jgi:hypothetical protein